MLQKDKYFKWMSDWVNTINKNYIKEKKKKISCIFSNFLLFRENIKETNFLHKKTFLGSSAVSNKI